MDFELSYTSTQHQPQVAADFDFSSHHQQQYAEFDLIRSITNPSTPITQWSSAIADDSFAMPVANAVDDSCLFPLQSEPSMLLLGSDTLAQQVQISEMFEDATPPEEADQATSTTRDSSEKQQQVYYQTTASPIVIEESPKVIAAAAPAPASSPTIIKEADLLYELRYAQTPQLSDVVRKALEDSLRTLQARYKPCDEFLEELTTNDGLIPPKSPTLTQNYRATRTSLRKVLFKDELIRFCKERNVLDVEYKNCIEPMAWDAYSQRKPTYGWSDRENIRRFLYDNYMHADGVNIPQVPPHLHIHTIDWLIHTGRCKPLHWACELKLMRQLDNQDIPGYDCIDLGRVIETSPSTNRNLKLRGKRSIRVPVDKILGATATTSSSSDTGGISSPMTRSDIEAMMPAAKRPRYQTEIDRLAVEIEQIESVLHSKKTQLEYAKAGIVFHNP